MILINKFIRQISHTPELAIEYNKYHRRDIFQQLIQTKPKTYAGVYDSAGQTKYRQKHQKSHYKKLVSNPSTLISSIGIGTYRGSMDKSDDLPMFNGLVDSLLSGINVIDSCRNFRGGKSQQIIGRALQYLVEHQKYSRNEFFIQSKAGYVRQKPIELNQNDVINDHCIHPTFLEAELNKSLRKIGVQSLDVYYLNNYAESQMVKIGKQKFQKGLADAFTYFQKVRSEKKIKFYGLSSWQSFRVAQEHQNYVNLQKIVKLAQKIGGKYHGFRFIQVPINIMMPEAFAQKNQSSVSLLQVAESLKINVISNSPLLSGSLVNVPLPSTQLRCNYNGAKHLQLLRSIPSSALVSTLIGQKVNRHIKKNLEVLHSEPLTEEEWLKVFVPDAQPNTVYENQEEQ